MADAERSTGDVEQIVARLPSRIRPAEARVAGSWLGRTLLRFAARLRQSQVLDRAMGVAAEVFTSVFPILILSAVWLGSRVSDAIADSIGMPTQTRAVLQDALSSSGASAFGLVGSVLVLISATSLSRAIAKAFAAIWELPQIKTGLRQAWRLLGALIILLLGMLLIRWLPRLTEDWPLEIVWRIVFPLLLTTVVGVLLPWILISGAVSVRRLVPGALVFGLIMTAGYPLSRTYLGDALAESEARYGTIGVAFTYIAFLYALSLCFLGSTLVGQVIATDDGRLGRWVRGDHVAASSAATASTAR